MSMSKGTVFFMVATLGAAIFFYNVNSFVSLICMLLFIGTAYATGKLG